MLATAILLGIHRDRCQVTMCPLNFSLHSCLVSSGAPLYRQVSGG